MTTDTETKALDLNAATNMILREVYSRTPPRPVARTHVELALVRFALHEIKKMGDSLLETMERAIDETREDR